MGIRICVATLLFAGFVGNIHAQHRPAVLSEDEIQIIHTPFFAESHPDLGWRLDNIERGHLSFVMDELLRAAHFGDKPSQAMVAEASWKGLYGQTVDRPLTYAWMDLAAERGYRPLLVKREMYWRRLSEKESQSALERGAEVYAQYGDDEALPRLEEKLRTARSKKTGSRLGSNTCHRSRREQGGDQSVEPHLPHCGSKHQLTGHHAPASHRGQENPPVGAEILATGPLYRLAGSEHRRRI